MIVFHIFTKFILTIVKFFSFNETSFPYIRIKDADAPVVSYYIVYLV